MNWLAAFAALLMVVAAPRTALAQSAHDSLPPIDADRPDLTDGIHTVAPGWVQLESGYTYDQDRGSRAARLQSLPEALLRIGIVRDVELRIGENYSIARPAGVAPPSVRGFDDTYLGTKVSVSEARGVVPGLGFEAQLELPTGSAAFSAGRVLPGGALLLGWEGDSPWSAGVEFLATQTNAHAGQGTASLSIQYQLGRRVQWYGEVYAVQPWDDPDNPDTQYANTGVHVLLTRDFAVDARAGAGLNQGASRFFVGAGFAIRR